MNQPCIAVRTPLILHNSTAVYDDIKQWVELARQGGHVAQGPENLFGLRTPSPDPYVPQAFHWTTYGHDYRARYTEFDEADGPCWIVEVRLDRSVTFNEADELAWWPCLFEDSGNGFVSYTQDGLHDWLVRNLYARL